MKRLAWNLLIRFLDLTCRADKFVLESPSGEIEIALCEGWCRSFAVSSHGYRNVGIGMRRLTEDVLPAYERKLRSEGFFVDADMLHRLLGEIA